MVHMTMLHNLQNEETSSENEKLKYLGNVKSIYAWNVTLLLPKSMEITHIFSIN